MHHSRTRTRRTPRSTISEKSIGSTENGTQKKCKPVIDSARPSPRPRSLANEGARAGPISKKEHTRVANSPIKDQEHPRRRKSAEHLSSSGRSKQQPPGLLSLFFGVSTPPRVAEKNKSAKLACSHRMCQACLKRIFIMSLTDPQHMPPRCCTADHIPLKHVEKLFDMKFKVKWNKKYQEYTTKNRIYCPVRGCGEWIKPSQISIDTSGGATGGRKFGKCSRCRTKICCLCNGKWHSGKDCPKDDDTKKFVAMAKDKGWQRCYNCSAMVELNEGCNHMTCRCTAEFCMICGSKWKTCECPWFNYGSSDRHRLRCQDELERRREQERQDEAFARRLQRRLAINDDDDLPSIDFGVNPTTHFVNDYFIPPQNVLLGNNRPPVESAAGIATAPGIARPGRSHTPSPPPNRARQRNRRNWDLQHPLLPGPLEIQAPIAIPRPTPHVPQPGPSERVTLNDQMASYNIETAHEHPFLHRRIASDAGPATYGLRRSATSGSRRTTVPHRHEQTSGKSFERSFDSARMQTWAERA
ncbi:hypothetical protein V8E54_004539 [Elaphomyces granulatus]